MGSTFNPQILVEKLTKLNNSQQSIETLSHWCIFHMNKAKLVVETWDRQFHSSPREQRLAFLYLANDILQNSRRKGAEFVAEFWRVLPEALRDVIRNGDETGRTSALRLITIWDERKVFGSRGHILKEEFMGKQPENSVNKSGRQLSIKLRQSIGNMLDKIVSDYETIYGGQLDEDALLSRCTNSISYLDKLIKDIGGGMSSGSLSGTGFSEELHGHHAALKECIEQLTTLESSRASLISHLRDALQEQELKLDQVRSQLQAAQSRSDQVANVYRQSVSSDSNMLLDEQGGKEAHASTAPPGFNPVDRQVNPVVYTRQAPTPDKAASADDDSRKSAAAAVAAKLTASTASAEMLSHVLTSLVSGVAFGNNSQESSGDPHHSEKRPKLENESASYTPPPPPPPPPQSQQPPPPLPPFPHPESLIQNANSTPTNTQSATGEQPPLPSSSPPPLPPLPPMAPYQMAPQFIQTAGSMSNVAYSYGATQQPPPPPLPGYPSVGVSVTGMSPYGPPPVNPYQPFPSSDGGFYSPSSSVPMAPISRQQTL